MAVVGLGVGDGVGIVGGLLVGDGGEGISILIFLDILAVLFVLDFLAALTVRVHAVIAAIVVLALREG